MGRYSDFQQETARYATAKDKSLLVETRAPFFILGIAHEPQDQYGPRWILTIKTEDGTTMLLTLADSSSRKTTFTRMKTAVSETNPVGPVVLTQETTRNGYSVYVFVDVDPAASAL
jgi:hypothetical protein